MSSAYAHALQAATEAAAHQHYPVGALYVVATPIGNLADMTLRALHVLNLVQTVACEDTRHTHHMLRAYGIDKAAASLLALHQHNEAQAAQLVIKRLQEGQRVACVSDAGTPGISDPGACLVAAVRHAGHPVVPLPGASSVTAALSVAGVHGGFAFIGFLPTQASARQAAIAALSTQACATVLLEAPHRMAALAKALAVLDARLVTVGRELTKQFEEIATLPAHALSAWLQTSAHRLQGEFVLVLHPSATPQENRREQQVLQLLLAELPLKTAVKLAADITGSARNTLYQAALALQKQAAP